LQRNTENKRSAKLFPKDFIEELNIKAEKHGILMKEKDGLKIIPLN